MRVFFGVTVLVLFAVAVVLGAMTQLRTRCEVCMEFRGRQACEAARAADEDAAILQATTAACSIISGGVTDGIRCGNTPPRSIRCDAGDQPLG
ncbi:hypothetical protein MK280_06280 [Myxococcota bacterium]|nr:hypothetical protein [Myxococcota bacterium]